MVKLKKIVFSIVILALISSIPYVSAQLSLGGPAQHEELTIAIGEEGEVHVVHEIKKNNSPKQLNTIDGTISNLKVIDVDGKDVEHGIIGLEKLVGVTIFPSDENVFVEYDLADVLFLKDGIWTWNYFYTETSTFIFPENIDLVFVNSNPVNIEGIEGITCHGCDMILEYIIDEPLIGKEVNWEEKKFVVGIRTLTEINSFSFDQPTRSISFEVKEDNKLITLAIPLELLWNPYEVYLDDQKILKHEFFTNETHTLLNFRPQSSGSINIIGTSVIPEFPIFAPLFLGITAVILLQFRNRFNLH